MPLCSLPRAETRVSVDVLRTTTLTRRVLEDSRRAPRRRRRRRPAAVGLGDSWHRGADNPRDVVFWGIRTAIKFRPSHMAVDLANRLIKELQLKPDHMTELSLASRDRAERPHRDRLASSRCVGFSRASAVVVHVLGDSIVTRTQIDSLLG